MAPSPFFYTPTTAEADSLAILHLKRDSLLPITLRTTADDGYAEGAVINTRFGSYPHSTLIGAEWGSQVRASKVDTGSRGRKGKNAKKSEATQEDAAPPRDSKKRKSDESLVNLLASPTKKAKQLVNDQVTAAPKVPIEAGSGFAHVLPPTPEAWTYSLDHRTQVVYTPDYSYILQRLRVKPGDSLIEAGAGSGSFTHAAARAVFNGYPKPTDSTSDGAASSSNTNPPKGQIYSFEYHEPRVHTLRAELASHGLDSIVHLTHRDVCNEGFVPSTTSPTFPNVTAIFLDLPAPWLALKHLSRENPSSPLDPTHSAHICTFSPCIEQVQATVSAMRKLGWSDIHMVEVQNKRLDVRRERVGLREEGLRGVNAVPATVEESVGRLREVEAKQNEFHRLKAAAAAAEGVGAAGKGGKKIQKIQTKAERLEQIKNEVTQRKVFKEGELVHRTEPEVKTHTSYLVFAVLPREWTEEDERACEEEWSVEEVMKVKQK